MNISDPAELYLAAASAPSISNGELSVWSVQELLRSGDKPCPVLIDKKSNCSPIKAIGWNPIVNGLFVTGGSTRNDSVIRLYDVNNLSENTIANGGIS